MFKDIIRIISSTHLCFVYVLMLIFGIEFRFAKVRLVLIPRRRGYRESLRWRAAFGRFEKSQHRSVPDVVEMWPAGKNDGYTYIRLDTLGLFAEIARHKNTIDVTRRYKEHNTHKNIRIKILKKYYYLNELFWMCCCFLSVIRKTH